jgi:hypothetical protein
LRAFYELVERLLDAVGEYLDLALEDAVAGPNRTVPS